MLHMKRSALILAGFVLLITGCASQTEPNPFSTLTIAPPLNPYQSATRTPAPPTPTVPLPTIQPLLPSPTPFTHVVQPGETLYGIALQYNISLDSLVSANPGMATGLLSIGSELIIPLGEEDELTAPTPTPYPLPQDKPACYQTGDGDLWCYTLVENNQDIPLENISLAFNLYNDDRELVLSQVAFPPLNLLFPGQRIPVGTNFSSSLADQDRISTTLLTAFPADQQDPQVLISDTSLEYSQENTIARISGSFQLLEGEGKESQVWIAAVGLSDGVPAGVRKWISPDSLEAGKIYPFEFQLYSLGPGFDSVDLLAEAY